MIATPSEKGTRLNSDRRMLFRIEPRPLFRRWVHGVVWLALLGFFVVCHGCHGDEDNELAVAAVKQRTPEETRTAAKPQAAPRHLAPE
jgi:hypothetical protein